MTVRFQKHPKPMISEEEAAQIGAAAASRWFDQPDSVWEWKDATSLTRAMNKKSKTITPTRRDAFFRGAAAIARLREEELTPRYEDAKYEAVEYAGDFRWRRI